MTRWQALKKPARGPIRRILQHFSGFHLNVCAACDNRITSKNLHFAA